MTAILLGGCAVGTKFDQDGSGDLEVPSPALPGLSANGNPVDPQAELYGSGGGAANDPQGTGGAPDQGTASSTSSVSSSSTSGGGNPPVDPPQMA